MINYSITARAVNPNLFEINQGQDAYQPGQGRGQAARRQGRGARRDRRHQLLRHGTVHRGDDHREVCPPHRRPRHNLLPRRHHGHPLHGSRLHARAVAGGQEDPPRRARRLLPLAQQQGGAETAEKFSSQNIQRVAVCWEPGSEFRNLLADAEFNLVATRSAQAAVLKAIKEGKTNVDISAPINPGNPGGGTSNPSDTTGQAKKHTLTVRSANESRVASRAAAPSTRAARRPSRPHRRPASPSTSGATAARRTRAR